MRPGGSEQIIINQLGLSLEQLIFFCNEFALLLDEPALLLDEAFLLLNQIFLIGNQFGIGIQRYPLLGHHVFGAILVKGMPAIAFHSHRGRRALQHHVSIELVVIEDLFAAVAIAVIERFAQWSFLIG